MRNRAFRRHQRERLYNKWLLIARQWNVGKDGWGADVGGIDLSERHLWIKRTMENMPICSKPFCCGNMRRLGKLTWQERRALVVEREQRELYL